MTFFPQTKIEYADSASIDAFGRARVSSPFVVAEMRFLHGKEPQRWDEVLTGGATSTHLSNESAVDLAVPATTLSSVIRQTFQTWNYQLGKSQIAYFTGVFGSPETGIVRRVGSFNEDDGLLLEIGETTRDFVVRSSTSGSPVDTKIPQASWNKDKLDGTGPSGFTLDTSKVQIFFVDYQWFGVGRVRFGFILDGVYIICHEQLHSNITTSVYMATPNLPFRYSIDNDGTGGAATLKQICSAVATEGGQDPNGVPNAITTGIVSDNYGTGSTYARLGVRLNPATLDSQVALTSLILQAGAGNDIYHWRVSAGPTVAGTVTWTGEPNSVLQTFIGDDTNTVSDNGDVIFEGTARGDVISTANTRDAAFLGSFIDGTPTDLFLTFEPGNAMMLYASLNWREPL